MSYCVHPVEWDGRTATCDNMARAHRGDALGHPFRPETTQPEPVAGRRLRLTPAASIRPRPVRWLWADRIPAGALTLLPGREGIGKSLALAWMAASLTRGTLLGIHHQTPRPVIYAASEDSWGHTVVPRLIAAGADTSMVYRVDVETELSTVAPLTLPTDTAELAEAITDMGVAALLLDPLMSVLSAGIDTHRDRELRTALDPLTALADETGCAVVGLAHFNKGATSDPLTLITGSRAFSAVSRSVIAMAKDPEDENGSFVMSQAKNNLGRLDLPHLRYTIQSFGVETDEGTTYVGRLEFTGESERGVEELLSDDATNEERSERDEAAEWIRAYLTDPEVGGESSAAAIYKAAERDGIAKRTLQRARKRAGVSATPTAPGRPSVWSLDPNRSDTQ